MIRTLQHLVIRADEDASPRLRGFIGPDLAGAPALLHGGFRGLIAACVRAATIVVLAIWPLIGR